MDARETLRAKAAEVETACTECARTEEEEEGGDGNDCRITLRMKKLKAFLERGRVGAQGETKSERGRGEREKYVASRSVRHAQGKAAIHQGG